MNGARTGGADGVAAGGPPRYRRETWSLRGSEGDDVVAEAWLSPEPGPVVVAGHGAESDRNAPYITGAAKAWAGRGLSVVAADAPLHGDRATGVPHPEMHDAGRADFIARAAADVRCLADAVEDRLGPRSLGYLGFSMGTQYGVQAVAADQRFRAAVFAVGGSATVAIRERFEDSSIALHEEPVPSDPVRFASAVSPRPVLMVNADGDEIFSRRAALALYDAFGVPKEITFFPGRHVDWRSPGQWYRRMEAFAREHLAGVSGERRSGMGP